MRPFTMNEPNGMPYTTVPQNVWAYRATTNGVPIEYGDFNPDTKEFDVLTVLPCNVGDWIVTTYNPRNQTIMTDDDFLEKFVPV